MTLLDALRKTRPLEAAAVVHLMEDSHQLLLWARKGVVPQKGFWQLEAESSFSVPVRKIAPSEKARLVASMLNESFRKYRMAIGICRWYDKRPDYLREAIQ